MTRGQQNLTKTKTHRGQLFEGYPSQCKRHIRSPIGLRSLCRTHGKRNRQISGVSEARLDFVNKNSPWFWNSEELDQLKSKVEQSLKESNTVPILTIKLNLMIMNMIMNMNTMKVKTFGFSCRVPSCFCSRSFKFTSISENPFVCGELGPHRR